MKVKMSGFGEEKGVKFVFFLKFDFFGMDVILYGIYYNLVYINCIIK